MCVRRTAASFSCGLKPFYKNFINVSVVCEAVHKTDVERKVAKRYLTKSINIYISSPIQNNVCLSSIKFIYIYGYIYRKFNSIQFAKIAFSFHKHKKKTLLHACAACWHTYSCNCFSLFNSGSK